jgi:nicotinate-nucleotide pyrophosphorylase (carboxylating)
VPRLRFDLAMSRHAAVGALPDDGNWPWPAGLRETLHRAGLDAEEALDVVERALSEDLGGDPGRDVTTEATIGADQQGSAVVIARAAGTVAGTALLPLTLAATARRLELPVPTVELRRADGDQVTTGDVIAVLTGPVRVLLVAERTALNLLCRLCGVATATRAWADRLAGTGATVLDTRKTTPGLRSLEKYAVRCGGGENKRMGLYDVAMVKDNHRRAAGSVKAAVVAVRDRFPEVEIQVEVTSVEEAEEAVAAGARFLLCDNMATDELRRVVEAVDTDAVELEATGGLTLERAREVAETGVRYLSVGALTHSAGVLDIALDVT